MAKIIDITGKLEEADKRNGPKNDKADIIEQIREDLKPLERKGQPMLEVVEDEEEICEEDFARVLSHIQSQPGNILKSEI